MSDNLASKGQLARLQKALTFWTNCGLIKFTQGPTLSNSVISWPNYSGTAQFKSHKYGTEFRGTKDSAQYTSELNDGALVQVYYDYRGSSGLSNAKIAYLPKPSKLNRSLLRFDYDSSSAAPIVHEICHFQLSSLDNFRLPSEKIPTIECFFELIARSFYLGIWKMIFPKAFSILNQTQLSYDEKLIELHKSDLNDYYTPVRLAEGSNSSNSPFWPLAVMRVKEW